MTQRTNDGYGGSYERKIDILESKDCTGIAAGSPCPDAPQVMSLDLRAIAGE
jgi:hypothetical protein